MNRLRKLRQMRGLSQTVVADFIFITQPRISDFENSGKIPSDILISLAEFFDVSTDYLLGISEQKRISVYNDLSDEEYQLVVLYRRLPVEFRDVLGDIISAFYKSADIYFYNRNKKR